MQCFPPATSNNCCPPETKWRYNLQVIRFSQVYLKTTESKRDEKTQQATEMLWNPLRKFLNLKIAYFVLFLPQNTIVV